MKIKENFTNAAGQKCRLSKIENVNGTYIATIYILDTNEYVKKKYEQIKHYL